MNLSNYLKNRVIEDEIRAVSLYLALFTAAPSPSGGGTEVVGGAYARQLFTLDAPTNGVTQNAADIVFPTPTASWGIITHAAVFDAASSGNMLLFGALNQAKSVTAGTPFKVLDGDFDFSLT